MGIGAVIGGLVGGIAQGSAAKKAAKAQERAANQDIAFQKETRDLIRNDLAPYRTGGYTAQQALDFELGLGARPMIDGTEYGGFTKTPGYDFRLNQGTSAIEAGAAARGGLFSGAAMRDLLQYGQDYASSEYNNFLNRLAGRADTGMNAATMSGQASQVAAGNVSNALAGVGNARAAGAIGMGNAISGGITNALGAWNYQNNIAAGLVPEGWTTR